MLAPNDVKIAMCIDLAAPMLIEASKMPNGASKCSKNEIFAPAAGRKNCRTNLCTHFVAQIQIDTSHEKITETDNQIYSRVEQSAIAANRFSTSAHRACLRSCWSVQQI